MRYLFFLFLFCSAATRAQKKPLTHDVYDNWQSIGERNISNNGQFVVYAFNPQEGDGTLVIQRTDNSYKKEIARGYAAVISEDNKYVVFRIRPTYKETRDAKIKKKAPAEMPKDSLGIVELGKDSVIKIAKVKSFRMPEKGFGWLAYHLEKADANGSNNKPKTMPDSLTQISNLMRAADSLVRVSDSLRKKALEAQTMGLSILSPKKKEEPKKPAAEEEKVEEGTELVLRNFVTGDEKKYKLVSEYAFNKKGNRLLIETTKKNGDSLSKAMVLWVDLPTSKVDTVMRKFNDAKNYAMDEEGTQLAFVAERDSVSKALRKFYKLWYYKPGFDTAQMRADKMNAGVKKAQTISAEYANKFSKDGKRLFVGMAPIREPKDTNKYDFETARLDIWNHKDDYLQPQQLVNLQQELKKSFLGILPEGNDQIIALADEDCDQVSVGEEGNEAFALGYGDKGFRASLQWDVNGMNKLFLVNVKDGSKKLIIDSVHAGISNISPATKFVLWYDMRKRNYFTYNTATGAIVNISKDIKVPVWDEEDDHPDDPPPHGFMRWQKEDAFVFVYDKYDVWKLDPTGATKPSNYTNGLGRANKLTYRYIPLDREEKYLTENQTMLFSVFDNTTKENGLKQQIFGKDFVMDKALRQTYPVSFNGYFKAKQANTFGYLSGTPQKPYNVKVVNSIDTSTTAVGKKEIAGGLQLSNINPQQADYNWLTVELHKWKMLDGKMSEGLMYKPENFDSTKKYPVIFYFYERDADTRYAYRGPAPSASTINVPLFVSNGYIVFDPDIFYKNGEPGASAYNSIVSAANYLKKMKFIDTAHMAIQGQSWGGYQVAYLITKTKKMFAAAGAGAPVVNMTSAYGGIRWGTGISRQFQYEHSQTRIGATPWQRLDLYLKNSALFSADKIQTPVLIMHNDKDGAVPWYQGIEFFTAMKRLGKPAWLLQYNDEDHNLMERRNRKDLSVRLSQFFDHFLKGAPAPRWMTDGVPATSKGIDWGF